MDERIVLTGMNDQGILDLFKDICDMMGYVVVEAQTPEDLVEKARTLTHDRCFMDANYGKSCTSDIGIAVEIYHIHQERFGPDISQTLLTTTGYHEAIVAVKQAGIPLAEKPLQLEMIREFLD